MVEKYMHSIDPRTVRKIVDDGVVTVLAKGRGEYEGELFLWWRAAENLEDGMRIIRDRENPKSVLGVGINYSKSKRDVFDPIRIGVWKFLTEETKDFYEEKLKIAN